MHFDDLSSATCPRCTAPIDIASGGCGRCGLALEPTPDGRYVQASGPLCPRCDRVDVPGAQFAGVTGRSEYGSCGNCGTPLVLPNVLRSSAYEERAVSAAAEDLERIARAEAVDGWQLLDTTVDPAAPERIIAHFRRSAAARRARVEAKSNRQQGRELRRRMQREAREARRQARIAGRIARMGQGRRPAGRHARGLLRGGNMAVVGLVSLAAHLLVLIGWVFFRFIALPMFMLALAIFWRVFEALVDELIHRPRRRAAYRRRHHARWV